MYVEPINRAIRMTFDAKQPFTTNEILSWGKMAQGPKFHWLLGRHSVCIAENHWGSVRASLTIEGSWDVEKLCLEEAAVVEVVEVKKNFLACGRCFLTVWVI